MKQGKRKNAAAEASAQSQDVAPVLPDAAYVDQLLGGTASAVSTGTVAVEQAMTDEAVEGVIDLPAQCLLRDAAEYRERLLKCVQAPSVVIDAGAVERIDTAFVQVLVAFVRSRADDNRPNESIVWRRVNPEFAGAVRLLGLQSALVMPDVSEAA